MCVCTVYINVYSVHVCENIYIVNTCVYIYVNMDMLHAYVCVYTNMHNMVWYAPPLLRLLLRLTHVVVPVSLVLFL